jgi:hypothetical protein
MIIIHFQIWFLIKFKLKKKKENEFVWDFVSHLKALLSTSNLSPTWISSWIFNCEQCSTVSLSFAFSNSRAKQVLHSPFTKLITLLLLHACVNYSRMLAIVVRPAGSSPAQPSPNNWDRVGSRSQAQPTQFPLG